MMATTTAKERAAGPEPAAATATPEAHTSDAFSVAPPPPPRQAGPQEAFAALVRGLHQDQPPAPADFGAWAEHAQLLIEAYTTAGAEGVRKVWRAWCKDRPDLAALYEVKERRAVTTLADLAGLLPKTRWLWEGWLPRGYLTLLVGATGVGKSWLTLGLAASILDGRAWPDGSPSPRTSQVVWADTEASQALLLERALGWGLPVEDMLLPTVGDDPLSDIRLDDAAGWGELLRLVDQERPLLVVVDSLSGGHKGDENSSEMRNLLHDLAALARNYNVAVLATHHLRKANPMEALDTVTLDRIRGSTAIPQFARLIMAVDRPDAVYAPERVRLQVIKSNLARFPEPLGFEIEDGQIVFGNVPAQHKPESQVKRAEQLVLDLLEGGPVPVKTIYNKADVEGISARTVRRAKSKLPVVSIKRASDWVWALEDPPPDEG